MDTDLRPRILPLGSRRGLLSTFNRSSGTRRTTEALLAGYACRLVTRSGC
jgi:hypothetical protein